MVIDLDTVDLNENDLLNWVDVLPFQPAFYVGKYKTNSLDKFKCNYVATVISDCQIIFFNDSSNVILKEDLAKII